MRRVRVTELRLIGIFAVRAVTAATALALPEFTGPFPNGFTSTSKASLLECTTDTNVGKITGPHSGEIQITFTGCKLGATPCNTPAAAPGTIVTSMLSMRIG